MQNLNKLDPGRMAPGTDEMFGVATSFSCLRFLAAIKDGFPRPERFAQT